MTFTGTATSHLNANDVANLTITFLDGAFENTATATNVTNVSNATGVVDFIDVTLTYSGSAFTEATALDGTIGNTITVTLAGDTFTVPGGAMTDVTHYSVIGLPANLTAVVTGTSTTTATITLSGTALAHANANDVLAGITIAFTNAAFSNTPASSITGFSKTDYTIDFGDAVVIYSGGGFVENITNNGGVTGSILSTISGASFYATSTLSTMNLTEVTKNGTHPYFGTGSTQGYDIDGVQ